MADHRGVRDPAALRRAVEPYQTLFKSFLNAGLAAENFERAFFDRYKNDSTAWPPSVFHQLETIFFAVDEFVSDEELRGRAGGLDEGELADEVRRVSTILSDLISAGSGQE